VRFAAACLQCRLEIRTGRTSKIRLLFGLSYQYSIGQDAKHCCEFRRSRVVKPGQRTFLSRNFVKSAVRRTGQRLYFVNLGSFRTEIDECLHSPRYAEIFDGVEDSQVRLRQALLEAARHCGSQRLTLQSLQANNL
jgi:hypothetical protein